MARLRARSAVRPVGKAGSRTVRSRRRGDDDSDASVTVAPHEELQRALGNRGVAALVARNIDGGGGAGSRSVAPTLAPDDERVTGALAGVPRSIHDVGRAFGDWESAERALRTGTGAAKALPKATRASLWTALVKQREIIAGMLGLQGASPLPGASTTPTSDKDLNISGPAPGAQLAQSRSQLDQLFPGWGDVYKMGLVVDASRLSALATELDRGGVTAVDREQRLADNALLAEELLLERRIRNLAGPERAAAIEAIRDERVRARVTRRTSMSKEERQADQDRHLKIADEMNARLATTSDPAARARLAAIVSASQMQANALTDDMYVTMQSGIDLGKGRPAAIDARHAYLTLIDQVDMLHHQVLLHGGVGPATSRYEVAKYASRVLESLRRAGVEDSRIARLLARANEVYRNDRSAAARGGFGEQHYEELRQVIDAWGPTLRAVAVQTGETGMYGPHAPALAAELPGAPVVADAAASAGVALGHVSLPPLPQVTKQVKVGLDDGRPSVSNTTTSTSTSDAGSAVSSVANKGFVDDGRFGFEQSRTFTAPGGTKGPSSTRGGAITENGVEVSETKKAGEGAVPSSKSLAVGSDGVTHTQNGKSVQVGKDKAGNLVVGAGIDQKLGKGFGAKASFAVTNGTTTERVDPRNASGAAGGVAELLPAELVADEETSIRSIAETSGLKVGGGVSFESGGFGAGVSASSETTDTARFFTLGRPANSDDPEWMQKAADAVELEPHLQGVAGLGDVDIDKLNKGEGYSFERRGASSIEGSVSAFGVSGSLGYDESGFQQTALAKTGDASFRVSMLATDDEGVSGDLGLKGIKLAASQRSGKEASVAFDASGPEGVAAVKAFQLTGLLPGAANIAAELDPDAWGEFENAKRSFDAAAASRDEAAILSGKAAMMSASKRVNRAFMESNGWTLPQAQIPGVSYDEHMTAGTSTTAVGLKLGPLKLMHEVSERLWQRDYRDGADVKHELGGTQSVSNVFSPNESESSVTMAKGSQAAWMLSESGTLGQESRDRLSRTGSQFMQGPQEVRDAWKAGTYDDAQTNSVAIAFTEPQLEAMKERLAVLHPEDAESMLGRIEELRSEAEEVGGSLAHMGMPAAPWIRQLGELRAAAYVARLRQAEQGDDAALDRLEHGVSATDLTTGFVKLTPEERRALVVSTAIAGNQDGYGQGWNALRLALRAPNRAERDALLRDVFLAVARRDDDANAPMELLAFLEQAAASEGVSREELNEVVGNTEVKTNDSGPLEHATSYRTRQLKGGVKKADEWAAAKLVEVVGRTDAVFGGMASPYEFADQGHSSTSAFRGDQVTDLLEGLRGVAGSGGLTRAIDAALAKDPHLLVHIAATLESDPARLAVARELLAEAKRPLPVKEVTESASWWSR